MKSVETNRFNLDDFVQALKSTLIKYAKEDKCIRIYSLNWSGNIETFRLFKIHFKERLGDIAKIKSAPVLKRCGYPLRGIEVNLLTDDIDLFEQRVNEMFNGEYISHI